MLLNKRIINHCPKLRFWICIFQLRSFVHDFVTTFVNVLTRLNSLHINADVYWLAFGRGCGVQFEKLRSYTEFTFLKTALSVLVQSFGNKLFPASFICANFFVNERY